MGRIQSDIGLVTGINIKDTVDKLIALQGATSRCGNAAAGGTSRPSRLPSGELLALTLGVQIAGKKFKDASLYSKKDITSSNAALITAATTGTVPAGSYQLFRSARLPRRTCWLAESAAWTRHSERGRFLSASVRESMNRPTSASSTAAVESRRGRSGSLTAAARWR